MKSAAFASLLLLALSNNASSADDAAPGAESAKDQEAGVEVDISPNKDSSAEGVLPVDVGDFCFFAGTPPSDVMYTVIVRLKVGKGTYGSVKDILPKFAGNAKRMGADAIIGYTGSQRFGFWPWRMVRPVVRGTAVKWASTPSQDCAAMGGSTLNAILATDTPAQ